MAPLLLASVLLMPFAAAEPAAGEPVVMVEPKGQKGPPAAAVVVSTQGLAVAPLQVVGNRRRVTVFISPSEQREATVAFRDEENGLALLSVGELPNARVPKFSDAAFQKGQALVVKGLEGGLPWQTGRATVVTTQTGPFGNIATGYITCDGENDGTGNDAGAAVLASDGRLAGVHLGRLRSDGSPGNRFVVMGIERLRLFLARATEEMTVGSLCAQSGTPGAQVSVDGKPVGRSPAMVKGLMGGWHTVRVAAPGYLAQERVMLADLEDAGCEDVTLERGGSITFTTQAKNALVSVDGAPFVPFEGEPLVMSAATHSLVFNAKGWRPFTWKGDVLAGKDETIALAMVREHGLFNITSTPPGAEVLIEGKLAGVTPIQDLKLSPGTWSVEVRLVHYRTANVGNVVVQDGIRVELPEVKLVPNPARLTLNDNAVESGDEVFLNGRRVTGRSWKVEAGYHDVEIRRSWHNPGKLRLLLQPDEERVVSPRPEPLPEGRERKLKIAAGVLGVGGTFLLAAFTVGLVSAAVLMLVGAKLNYDAYHLQTERDALQRTYGLSNGLLWGGIASGLFSVLVVAGAVASVAGGVWALLTLPSDPSRRPQSSSSGSKP